MPEEVQTKSSGSSFFKIIILAVVFGIFVGILAQLIYQIYFTPPLFYTGDIVIRRQSMLELSKKIEKIAKDNEASLLTIYQKKSAKQQNEPYFSTEILGRGVVLTNDGWILAYLKDNITDKNLKDKIVVKTNNLDFFEVKSLITDPATKITFIKIEAKDLVPVQFSDSNQLIQNEQVVVVSGVNSSQITNVESLNYYKFGSLEQLITDSEEYSKYISIQDKLALDLIGSPIFNLDGEVIGLLKEFDNQFCSLVIASNNFKDLINQVLYQNKITRPYLGVNYIDLSRAVGSKEGIFKNKKGALVYKGVDGLAIKKDSPALGLLKDGDIILKIDNEDISNQKDLAQIILDYQPSQKIKFELLRNNQTKTVEITLGKIILE